MVSEQINLTIGNIVRHGYLNLYPCIYGKAQLILSSLNLPNYYQRFRLQHSETEGVYIYLRWILYNHQKTIEQVYSRSLNKLKKKKIEIS